MSGWTEERTAELIHAWNGSGNQARTALQIAEQWGMTRNAILGKVHRLREKGVHLVTKSNGHGGTTRKSTKRKRKDPTPSAQHQNGADAALAKKARQARAKGKSAPAAADGQARRNPPFRKPAEPAAAPTVGVPYQHLLRDRRSGITGDRCLWRVNPHWETRVMCCGAGTPPGKAFCGTHAEAARR